MNQPDDLLGRAVNFLRAAPEPGWDVIAQRVIAAVRATPRPGGWPLRAHVVDHSRHAGAIFVSDHVLRSSLVVALRQRYLCAPTAIRFAIDGEALRAVHIDVTGSYGTELLELAHRIRATTVEVITEVLGAPTGNRHPIDITITDVVTGDPLLM